MSKKKQSMDRARYYPPEMMPFALCSACLDIVLEQWEKAREKVRRAGMFPLLLLLNIDHH